MKKNKIAIIGAGSSGLITLKTLLDHLCPKEWEITCFEKSGSIQGCWGAPYEGFISTSTKYTTQFSCFAKYSSTTDPNKLKGEFFKNNEYGQYLEHFTDHFGLHPYIKLNTRVLSIVISDNWIIEYANHETTTEEFTHVVLCTGLAEVPTPVFTNRPTLKEITGLDEISNQQVVVIGGGESAADIADRLAKPELSNEVYLSLKRGIRVSPRYHPIKGVPSDFLRNRLMLSISRNTRNKIGQKFVEARIKFQETFEYLFPPDVKDPEKMSVTQRRKEWDFNLTTAAKDELFNMFHNKSDGFLDAVGEQRIKIIGAPTDESYTNYLSFQGSDTYSLAPDLIVPRVGYQSRISELFDGKIKVSEFYRGCQHYLHDSLFLIGFARPIIGNIPSISEQQALYVAKLIAAEIERPTDIVSAYHSERKKLKADFPRLNSQSIYPVEMMSYCDALAQAMGTYPSLMKCGLKRWINIQLSPATTLHYTNYGIANSDIYTPKILNLILVLMKGIDAMITASTRLRRRLLSSN